jgi:hypothetical protein
MSLLDTASLIVTPNGYKEGKLYSVIPSDGSGDLSVTRATTATRVNSAGLVELVPYNLFSYSQDLTNAAYTSGGTGSVVVTANYGTAPDGTTTADRVQITRGATYQEFFQRITGYSGQQVTMSFYAKSLSGTPTLITAFNDGYYNEVTFTTEWVRYEYTFTAGTNVTGSGFNLLTFVSFPSTSASADLLVWGVQLVQGSTAKDYQKTETRLNIPRLDYSNGTCPSLLVEPQRTNLFTYSSSFDNAAWTKNSVTITANATTSPSGVQDADKMILGNGSQVEPVAFQLLDTTANTRTLTFFAKASEYNIAFARVGGSVTVPIVLFELSGNGSILHNQNALSYSIEPLENGWYRCSMTYAHGIAFAPNVGVCSPTYSVSATSVTSTGNGTSGIFIWGAQVEVGSYATSYIPTTSASVTRNADVISKTGISSLIGQTEGVIFYDFILSTTGVDFTLANLYSSSNANSYSLFYINPSNQVGVSMTNNGSTQCDIVVPTLALGRHRIAFAYKQNDFAVYVDGQLIATDTNGTIPTMDNFNLIGFNLAPSAYRQEVNIYAAALWKTRLTNTQLAQLTTI